MSESKRILAAAGVLRKKDLRGRTRGYTAQLGLLEADGATSRDAVERLSKNVEQLAGEITSPIVLWGLSYRECWVMYRDAYGWSYMIHRPMTDLLPNDGKLRHLSRYSGRSAFKSKSECEDAMRQHWADTWIMPIVYGILGLGGYRAFNCPKCSSAFYGWPDQALPWAKTGACKYVYACRNPRCGHEATETF